jgi:hypothetical protein
MGCTESLDKGKGARRARTFRRRAAFTVWDLVVEMTPTVSIPQLGSEFDDFLFAAVGDDANGMTVSVLSALARLGVDPRQEAANLAQLPGGPAIERLTLLLATLPGGISANPGTIATRLIPHLTRRTGPGTASRETRPHASTTNKFPTVARMTVISLLFVAYLLGAQWIITSHQPPAGVADGHAAASDTDAAQER